MRAILEFQILFQLFRAVRFVENRVGDGFVKFDRFVIDAARLRVIGKMIDDERRFNSLHVHKLRVAIFFLDFFAAGAKSFVNCLGRQILVGEFKFDRVAVGESQFDDFVAFAESRCPLADIRQIGFAAPVAAQQIIDARADSAFEIFHLVFVLNINRLRRTVENPARLAQRSSGRF